MNPFDFWNGIVQANKIAARNGRTLAETIEASGAVIESRSHTIASAARNPFAADHAELGRMVPEKLAAFSQAGMSAWDDLCAIQAQAIANWQQLAGIALRGRTPTTGEIATMAGRSTAITRRSVAATGKALAPIHAAATGNAKRLARKAR